MTESAGSAAACTAFARSVRAVQGLNALHACTGSVGNTAIESKSTQSARLTTIAKQMAEQGAKRRGNPAWTKGGPSPNPKGRPRTGLACAEKVRELVDPADWVTFELSIANDVSKPVEQRQRSWHALIDRGFVKPPTHVDTTVRDGDAGEYDFSKMSIDEQRDLLAKLESARVTGEPASGQQPNGVTDDNHAADGAPCHEGAR